MTSFLKSVAATGALAIAVGMAADATPAEARATGQAGRTGLPRTASRVDLPRRAAADPIYHWTFYATFATAGACFAAAAAYKNEYWWVEATTCIRDATHNTWMMFYES